MKRRTFLRIAGAAGLAQLGGCGRESAGSGAGGGATGGGAAGVEAGRSVAGGGAPGSIPWSGYDDAVVIDALAGPIQFNIPQEGLPLGPSALEAVSGSGITAVNLTVNGRASEDASAYENTVARIDAWTSEVQGHGDVLSVIRSVADIAAARESGRLGLILGFQDTVPFEHDLALIDDFRERGVLIVQLTYNVQNLIGTGCLAPEDAGLTELGRAAVARLDERGVLIDLSHCGQRTTLDAIAAASGPVSITHSGCNAVFRHPRSKDDDTLRLMADRGGVLGIYLMPFLNPAGPPTAEDVMRHIDHALNVCGEDHVGIGTDQGIVPLDVSGDFPSQFDAVSAQRSALGIAAPREDTIPYVPELNHPRRLETIAALMEQRGHPTPVVEKVLGTNFMRLFSDVWTDE